MAAPIRYTVMNDYNTTIDLERLKPDAYMDTETAVGAKLKERIKYNKCIGTWDFGGRRISILPSLRTMKWRC
jgi:hypothetical protein